MCDVHVQLVSYEWKCLAQVTFTAFADLYFPIKFHIFTVDLLRQK